MPNHKYHTHTVQSTICATHQTTYLTHCHAAHDTGPIIVAAGAIFIC